MSTMTSVLTKPMRRVRPPIKLMKNARKTNKQTFKKTHRFGTN